MYVSMNWQNDKSQASRNCQDCLMSKWTITHVTFKGNPSSQFLFTNSLQITNTWYSALWFSIHNIFLLIHVLHSMLIIHIKNLDKKLSWGRDKKSFKSFLLSVRNIQRKFTTQAHFYRGCGGSRLNKKASKRPAIKKGHQSIEGWPWPSVAVVWTAVNIRFYHAEAFEFWRQKNQEFISWQKKRS